MTEIVPAEYAWRVERARALMVRENCDLMILDSGESLAWISGYTVSETMYRAVFLPREGAPWFILRALDEAPCREGGWITDVAGYPDTASPETFMVEELRRRGFADARIGVDFNSVSWNPARAQAFTTALPQARFVNLMGATDSLRWVKSAHEIAQIANAAAIADSAMAQVAAAARPGFTTREAAAIAAASFLREGADTGETGPIVRGSGSHEFLHGLFRTDELAPGDILHVELIPRVAHYGARIMRPILIGAPTARQKEIAENLIRLQDAQIAAMKPGAIASDVDRIVRQGVLDAGLRAEYDNVSAYTLGLYIRTPRSSDFSRVFLPDQHWPLEENMVFHVYTTAEGLGFSESVVVTPEGGRRLTQTPRRMLLAGE
ncbi:M24 family metallopeptidase [Pseudaminobacter salicylatoxidans]|uniref:M24 family metallopeptidase n=1 Tax=Pseudaminobacter salicylatoxidans TaxID=93369 RepID=UPI00031833C2|nr:Xaa-Pro peptidase family protein [Pseudaminobacter salicylatoxidans]